MILLYYTDWSNDETDGGRKILKRGQGQRVVPYSFIARWTITRRLNQTNHLSSRDYVRYFQSFKVRVLQ